MRKQILFVLALVALAFTSYGQFSNQLINADTSLRNFGVITNRTLATARDSLSTAGSYYRWFHTNLRMHSLRSARALSYSNEGFMMVDDAGNLHRVNTIPSTLVSGLFSGAYNDLTGKPSLFSGSYLDLTNKPTIPAAQIQSDWDQVNSASVDYIKNKPTMTSGTVTSIGITGSDFSISNSPITSSGNIGLTLATVNSNVGTFNNLTVNGKGLVTAASNVAYLTANQTITLSGDVSGAGTTSITTTLANSGVSAGTYDYITVNAKGIVTAGYNKSSSTLSSKSFNTGYQASNTGRTYDLDVTCSINIGASLISTNGGNIALEISANGSSGWVEKTRMANGNGGLASATNQQTAQLTCTNIPAGYYWRLTSTTTAGTVSFVYVTGNETLCR